MPHLLALDQGTTSSRALIFDEAGEVVALARRELRQIFPQPGWVEHDAQEIWAAQLGVAVEVLAAARLTARDVAAIGITNQRETTVVWERATGRPIANAIVWQDRRTADRCRRLREQGLEPLFAERTGLRLDPYFSATKLAWLLDSVPGARAAAAAGELAFGTVDCWLLWNLTGGPRGGLHATDVTNASRTLLWNLATGDWDDELLGVLDIPRALLPRVRSSCEVYGETAPELLGGAVPIGGIAGDQQAALFGQACLTPGLVKNTYGTGAFLLLNTGERPIHSRQGLLASPAWRLGANPTVYALEGSVFVAGAVVQWLRDGLGIIRQARDVEALAASVPDSGGVVLVPAFTGLGAPHWDPHARGTLVGVTRGTTAAHVARAALEGIACQVADLLQAMVEDAGVAIPELRVDGGAAMNDLLLQMQADIAGVPVARPKVSEVTALGAARLAGLAVGVHTSPEALAAGWHAERVFAPSPDRAGLATALRRRWARAVERAKAWVEEDAEPPS